MFKKLFTSLLLLSAAVLVLTACVPTSRTASFTSSTPVPVPNMTTREVQVDSVEVKVRQSQPTAQIDAIVRGHLTEACAVLSEPAFAYADHTFQIKVMASSPTDRGCAQITSQFESDFPLNAVDLQAGTYTVTVNGLSKVFTLTPPNLSTPDTSTVPAAFCSDPVELDAQSGKVTFNGVTLTVDPSLAKSVTAQSCPAYAYQMDQVEPGTTHPAYTSFKFPTDRQRIDFQPELRVYTVEGDMSVYLYPMNSLGDLKNTLKLRPDPATWFDGTVLHVRRSYLDLASGAGVRGVVEYAQDIFYFNNNGLLYEFDGLSQDGHHYINLRYPIAAPFLIDIVNGDPKTNVNPNALAIPASTGNYEDQRKNVEAYNTEAVRRFGQMADSDFTPDLAKLDALVKSIQITTP